MELNFHPKSGSPFTVEVDYFDTISEIKEKVQKYHGIPMSDQTLIFNEKILQDQLNIHYSDILDQSRINLLLPSDEQKSKETADESPISSKINLVLKMPSPRLRITLEMDINETILKLKEKIHEKEGIVVSRMTILVNGIDLHDHKSIKECELSDNSEVDVLVQSPPIPTTSWSSSGNASGSTSRSSSGNAAGSRRLKVFIRITEKIPLEVDYMDNVGELRKKLQMMNVDLPQEGYFFIYKQNVMEDDRSFWWHHVCQGDTIDIFSGSVSGGS